MLHVLQNVSSKQQQQKKESFDFFSWRVVVVWWKGLTQCNVPKSTQVTREKKSIIFIFPCVENNAIKNNNANTFPNRKNSQLGKLTKKIVTWEK